MDDMNQFLFSPNKMKRNHFFISQNILLDNGTHTMNFIFIKTQNEIKLLELYVCTFLQNYFLKRYVSTISNGLPFLVGFFSLSI